MVATLGLAPLSLVFFQQVSLVGFAANLVAIPLVTLVVTPLALLGVLAPPLWTLGAWVVGAGCARGWPAWPWPAAVWSAAARLGDGGRAGGGGAARRAAAAVAAARAGAAAGAAAARAGAQRPPPGRFELLAADVGQGTAVLVRTRRHLLVYDAGPHYSRESDAGQRVLLPLLRALGETRIDLLVLSHRDTDHVGGARAAERHRGRRGGASLDADHPLLVLAARATPLRRRPVVAVGRRALRGAAAAAPAYGGAAKPNALSCVLSVEGDRGARCWPATSSATRRRRSPCARVARLAARPCCSPRTTAAGRRSDAALPRRRARRGVAMVQAGYRNRFGHPAPDVVARYAQRGIAVVASPSCGAWRWQAGAGAGLPA